MRGRFAWLLAGVGIAAAASRFLRGRPVATSAAPATPTSPEPEADPRADELRRRIDDARGLEEERDSFEEAETPVDRAVAPEDAEAGRRHVHDRGRAAIDRMRGEPQ